MNYITPIDSRQEREVLERTLHYIGCGEDIFERSFDQVPVFFDLKGRASGMYRVRGCQRVIRYNPWIFASYYDDCLASTVPHEVAHYLSDVVFGLRNIRPHGREWKALMKAFGADASVTASYSLEGVPLRRTAKFRYYCACDQHFLGTQRHRRIVSGRTSYRCRRCGETLRVEI